MPTQSKTPSRRAPRRQASAVIDVRSRRLNESTKIQLFVRAGGRCEFPGCNQFLLEHHLTLVLGNYAQAAHIVAFSRQGPRADASLSASYINAPDNLMLLCQRCHKLIDDRPVEYTVDWLKLHKGRHEDRIHHLAGISADLRTTVVRLTARIAGRAPTISFAEIAEAVNPRYPADRRGVVIDLTKIAKTGEELLELGTTEIRTALARLTAAGLDGDSTEHLSVFALAPIPLLVFLGRELSDKQQLDLFQRHRDADNWKWKETGAAAEFELRQVRPGDRLDRVAMCLSLSGRIDIGALPPLIDSEFAVYEIVLANRPQNPMFLERRADLQNFRRTYVAALRQIVGTHPELTKLHLFPAVPAPVAIVCGHALLPKVDPTLLVYDADKTKGGFKLALTVN